MNDNTRERIRRPVTSFIPLDTTRHVRRRRRATLTLSSRYLNPTKEPPLRHEEDGSPWSGDARGGPNDEITAHALSGWRNYCLLYTGLDIRHSIFSIRSTIGRPQIGNKKK